MLKLFNSLTQKKALFKPIVPGKIGLYACGMTVYDYCHIGHARALITYDMIVRYLRSIGFEVNYVRNITDIDDKIIKRANENQEHWQALTQRFIQAMHDDEKQLGILAPDHEPRATEFIPQIIELIKTIVDKGYGYATEQGDVYFTVRKFPGYGKLSHRDIDSLLSGVRIGVDQQKQDPLDFALWKSSRPDEPSWNSPWGKGRPGWHIECSAMSANLLGQPFDIHGGGLDLKFPHHENEIAQSEAAHDKAFAHTWMHVGLLQINKEKMSKSLGNFLTIAEVLKDVSAETLRYFMISGHYRSPISYSADTLSKAQQSLSTLYTAIRGLSISKNYTPSEFTEKFQAVMNDDINTPEALAVLFSLSHHINKLKQQKKLDKACQFASELVDLSAILGILQQDPEVFLKGQVNSEDAKTIDALIAKRNQARANKDWAEADRFRDQLSELGVVIEDGAQGTSWRRES